MNDLGSVFNQAREAILTAFIGWVLFPGICAAIGYGEIVIAIHDKQMRDLRVTFGMRNTSPPKIA